MKLLRGLKRVPAFAGGTVATIGNFDGVHLGHQALLSQLRAQATRLQIPLVVILFEPQPNEFFNKSTPPARLSSLRDKLQMLAHCQVDYVYCLPFNNKLATMSATLFADTYFFSLLNVTCLLVGEDFRFGHKRQGDVTLLKEMAKKNNCQITIFPDFSLENFRISSTKVREALAQSQLHQAAQLLGRPYSLCGRVIKGDGRGRQWGIPTANIAMHRLTPALCGVFCVKVRLVNGTLINGVANLGRRPTLDGSKNVLEVHLFNFDAKLYGDILQVYFFDKLREEIKFSSSEALIAQIHEDVAAAKAKFNACSFEFNTLPDVLIS